jgi:hypothetical protein
MDYGPHTALVEEVIAFIAQGGVLRPTAPADEANALVLDNLETAKEYAWSRQIADDESPTWNDLREDQAAPFHAVPYAHPELKPAYDAAEGLLEQFLALLREKLPREYAHLIDDVAGDLANCARNRALNGLVEDSFWERVWRIYRQGAWPCGWEGDYPAGRIVIYQPAPKRE